MYIRNPYTITKFLEIIQVNKQYHRDNSFLLLFGFVISDRKLKEGILVNISRT